MAAAILLGPCIANANLIPNGSFELGGYNNADADPRPEIMLVSPGMTNITGWSVQGPGGVHWIEGADQASDGSLSIDLQGLVASPLSSMSTTFATNIGQQYRLTFDTFAGRTRNRGVVSVGNLQDQELLGPLKEDDVPVYGSSSHLFLATAATSTLTFRVTSSANGYGPVIDNIAVVAVPEAGTAILLLAGLATLLAFARKGEADSLVQGVSP
jgi:Protein of unknown function (DUF642)